MWLYRIHFVGDREFIAGDPWGYQDAVSVERELPYLESLLSFLELDLSVLTPVIEEICGNWERFFATGDREFSTKAMQLLGQLTAQHVYFHLPYLRWFERTAREQLKPEMADELRLLPAQLAAYQKQAQTFVERILDFDRVGRDTRKNLSENYLFDQPQDPDLFCFQTIPVNFEPVREGGCAEVLYPNTIRDIIDFSLRECVRRDMPVRRCKNCGRYFPLTGRVTAEYCSRPNPRRKPCKNSGAALAWENEKSKNLIFKEYRREYKRHFAWIRMRKYTEEDFADWSLRARAKRDECEAGQLTLEEFKDWLKES